jgi:glycosyltransferase involved in cell wall biosynthesis
MTAMSGTDFVLAAQPDPSVAIALSVIVPVFDQAKMIAENVQIIRERLVAGMDAPFEIIVVSDGSVDGTAERVIERDLPDVRVLYYDRNLGKGYAVKTGAREARGRWVSYIDADLDLDPSSLPGYVETCERDDLDFAIGSKRHPDSKVIYPRSRVIASWLYQQFVRVFFQLDVRDTQVGIKVFRHEVAKEVMPLLLVKRYAFDVELLAVSRAFGYGRVKEMPISLDYRFTGSGVRSMAVAHALVDTLAVFYRLRILGFYQRRAVSLRHFAWNVESDGIMPLVTAVDASADMVTRRAKAEAADGKILAFVEPGAHPSANWLSSTLPFFGRSEIAAVVTPQLSPSGGDVRQRAAAAIGESRLGSGSLNFRFKPGSIRITNDFPARSFLVRRDSYLALDPSTPPEQVVFELDRRGGRTLYLPDASVTMPPAPLFRSHLRRIGAYGLSRGLAVRTRGMSALGLPTLATVALLLWATAGWLLLAAGQADVWIAVWAAYLGVIGLAAFFGGLRYRSARVGILTAGGLVLTHFVFALLFMSGLVVRRRGAGSS